MKYEIYKRTQSKTTIANTTECFTLRVKFEQLQSKNTVWFETTDRIFVIFENYYFYVNIM